MRIKNNNAGMTLLEIMIVLAILGGLIGILGSSVLDKMNKAKIKQARIQMSQIISALEMYYSDCGTFPTSEEGLWALVKAESSSCKQWGPNPYLKDSQLKDPFMREFEYSLENDNYDILFLGKDGRPGGDGYDLDISKDEL